MTRTSPVRRRKRNGRQRSRDKRRAAEALQAAAASRQRAMALPPPMIAGQGDDKQGEGQQSTAQQAKESTNVAQVQQKDIGRRDGDGDVDTAGDGDDDSSAGSQESDDEETLRNAKYVCFCGSHALSCKCGRAEAGGWCPWCMHRWHCVGGGDADKDYDGRGIDYDELPVDCDFGPESDARLSAWLKKVSVEESDDDDNIDVDDDDKTAARDEHASDDDASDDDGLFDSSDPVDRQLHKAVMDGDIDDVEAACFWYDLQFEPIGENESRPAETAQRQQGTRRGRRANKRSSDGAESLASPPAPAAVISDASTRVGVARGVAADAVGSRQDGSGSGNAASSHDATHSHSAAAMATAKRPRCADA